MNDRDELLTLGDDELAKRCAIEPYKSGGPGGQKRNKTSSAVRVSHEATGVSAYSSDFRSQAQNRVRALHRLRFKLATEVRTPIELKRYQPPAWFAAMRIDGKLTTNPKNPNHARIAAHALDLFAACEGRAADTATMLGISTSHLVKFLQAEDSVWTAAAHIRSHFGLPRLVR